jgi:ATP-binding cassette subfamily G (WHITE) protein 2 (PDR)
MDVGIIGAAPGSSTESDWPSTWQNSAEYAETKKKLPRMREGLPDTSTRLAMPTGTDREASEFVASFGTQFWATKRAFEQYWHTPSYIYSKTALCIFSLCCSFFSYRETISNGVS